MVPVHGLGGPKGADEDRHEQQEMTQSHNNHPPTHPPVLPRRSQRHLSVGAKTVRCRAPRSLFSIQYIVNAILKNTKGKTQ